MAPLGFTGSFHRANDYIQAFYLPWEDVARLAFDSDMCVLGVLMVTQHMIDCLTYQSFSKWSRTKIKKKKKDYTRLSLRRAKITQSVAALPAGGANCT
jgi:hypothetical protein